MIVQTSFLYKNNLDPYFPTFFSFNIGKYFTSAGGALIKNNNRITFRKNLLFNLFLNLKAHILVKSRMYNSKINFRYSNFLLSYLDIITKRLNLSRDKKFFTITKYQLKLINSSVDIVRKNENIRINNHIKISESIAANSKFKLLSNNVIIPAYKVVFIVKKEPQTLHNFLAKKNIHFYRLFLSPQSKAGLVNFNKIAHKIFEISCESSIPKNEIINICNILKSY